MTSTKKWSVRGIGVAAAVVISLLASVSMAFASLTFNNTSITGDANSTFDATGTISIGASTATGITIGNSNSTVSIPGSVTITGATTTVNNLVGLFLCRWFATKCGSRNISGTYDNPWGH